MKFALQNWFGLLLEGNLCVFALSVFVLFCICGQFPKILSPCNFKFLCYGFAGLMFGRGLKLVAAYFRQASQHVYMRCWCHSCHLQILKHTVMQNNSTFTTPVANTSKELLCLFIFRWFLHCLGQLASFWLNGKLEEMPNRDMPLFHEILLGFLHLWQLL